MHSNSIAVSPMIRLKHLAIC